MTRAASMQYIPEAMEDELKEGRSSPRAPILLSNFPIPSIPLLLHFFWPPGTCIFRFRFR